MLYPKYERLAEDTWEVILVEIYQASLNALPRTSKLSFYWAETRNTAYARGGRILEGLVMFRAFLDPLKAKKQLGRRRTAPAILSVSLTLGDLNFLLSTRQQVSRTVKLIRLQT